jgi:hypothetical protein
MPPVPLINSNRPNRIYAEDRPGIRPYLGEDGEGRNQNDIKDDQISVS